MYVPQSNACTVPNGSTPVSARRITRGQQILMQMNTQSESAKAAFEALLCRLDLNTNGWPVAEYGGTPSACGSEGATPIGGNNSGIVAYPAQLVVLPVPQAVPPTTQSSYAAPPAPAMPSLVTQGHRSTKRPPASPTNPAPAAMPTTIPTTGNVCKDLILGWALQSQVTVEQLVACANAGYSGVLGKLQEL